MLLPIQVCSVVNNNSFTDIHNALCHPGVTRLLHYVRSKNLPYSTDDVKTVCRSCRICSEVKPNFYKPTPSHLIKATKPFERLNLEDSNSPWRAQILVDRSPNHKPRMCVDYSDTINRFTLLDAYPSPNIDEIVQKMAQYPVLSGEDCSDAFHQVALPEDDKKYTAFQAGRRLYQFPRVPFGLRNSGAVFQRINDDVIKKNGLRGVMVYMWTMCT